MAVITVNAGWKTIGDARVVLNSDQQIAVNCGEAEVLITPLADDMVHIQIVRGVGSKHINSWAIAKEKWDLPKHELEQDEKSITITLKDMTVRLTKSPLRISFLTPQGEVINQDDSSKGMAWDGEQVRVWKTMPENELYSALVRRRECSSAAISQ